MQRPYYIGIFLISFATLLLELALTRVLSVALWSHFSFLVISTAMLGFGASGVALALWTELRERMPLDRTLAALSIGFGMTTIASFWGMQHIPFDLFLLGQPAPGRLHAGALLSGAGFAVFLVGTRDRAPSYARLAQA